MLCFPSFTCVKLRLHLSMIISTNIFFIIILLGPVLYEVDGVLITGEPAVRHSSQPGELGGWTLADDVLGAEEDVDENVESELQLTLCL